MHNNYNNTTNNFNMVSTGFQTQLVRFDKPELVLLDGSIKEIYGMILANTLDKDKNGSAVIRTYRIPLVDKFLQPSGVRDASDEFFSLPADRILIPKTFRQFLELALDSVCAGEALDDLRFWHFTHNIEQDSLTVRVSGGKDAARLSCDWFILVVQKAQPGWFTPVEVSELCDVQAYLGKPLKFVPASEKDQDDITAASQLNDIMDAFVKHNIYTNGRVMNDGVWSYSQDIGRMAMTRETYLSMFTDAYPLYTR